MTVLGHDCGKPETSKTVGNVVHSVNLGKGGVGAIISPDYARPQQLSTCYEGSGIISYKNKNQGVHW